MKKQLSVLLTAVIIGLQQISAVPAKRQPITFSQPDGTKITLIKTGDERCHVTMTPEGYPVLKDAEGYYNFAHLSTEGKAVASGIRVAPLEKLSAEDLKIIYGIEAKKVDAALKSQRATTTKYKAISRANSHNGIGLITDAFLGYNELKGLVILAEYKDVKFSSMTNNAFFTSMLNDKGFNKYGGTGSARDYFIDQSSGKFTPEFDVYGPVTLPENMAYYGGNSGGDDKAPEQMIIDACKALDGQINFKDYDIDGDGYVDNVFLFYAGYGEASYGDDDSVWPHQWELSGANKSLTLDGVKIDRYACSNELELDYNSNPIPDGIGTFVHEFSHVIGLPDLYDTSGNDGCWTPYTWSVMDMGPYNNDGRTPPSYSSYERNALGWIDPIEINGSMSINLEDLASSNQCYIVPTNKQYEFYLFENRQQIGWDKYLPGHGMLVWHIDYNSAVWDNNSVNNNRNHNYVDLVEACGKWYDLDDFTVGRYYDFDAYDAAVAGYAFPGTSNVTAFTDDTKPSMKTWSGDELHLPITNILERNGVISFDVAGGKCLAEIPTPTGATESGTDYFVAAWQPAEGATGYRLTVKALDSSMGEGLVTADFGSGSTAKLPNGWSFISNNGATYTTADNYGASKPSLKLSVTGSGFQTNELPGYVKTISFWMKGQGTSNSSYLKIEGWDGTSWQTIGTYVPTNQKPVTKEINQLNIDTDKLRFTYNKSAGNLALDDVKITYAGGEYVVKGYDGLEVGNVTSYKVTGLPTDGKEFSYKVSAMDVEGHYSAYSTEKTVTLGQTGIDNITVDNATTEPIEYYNLQGIRVENPTSGIYIMRQGNTTRKVVK